MDTFESFYPFLLICVPLGVGLLPGTRRERLMRAVLTLLILILIALGLAYRDMLLQNQSAHTVHGSTN